MNHDVMHCADYSDKCPKKCYRAQLVRELQKYEKFALFPVSWGHLKETNECPIKRKD